jgi:hypothetical protein
VTRKDSSGSKSAAATKPVITPIQAPGTPIVPLAIII